MGPNYWKMHLTRTAEAGGGGGGGGRVAPRTDVAGGTPYQLAASPPGRGGGGEPYKNLCNIQSKRSGGMWT